ncbi:MAG: HNH/ENDO VII family nuclease [Bacteroidales bacterium]|nr:HNH/ENDO VII family nuclease [Candidatus Egerieousia equi]
MLESQEGTKTIGESIEDSPRYSELSHSQISYLKELNIPSEQWNCMDIESKRICLSCIADRFNELGIKDSNLIKTILKDNFSHELAESFHLPDTDKFNKGEEISNCTELTIENRKLLQEETGWSDEIVNAIKTSEEADIYKAAGLKDVNGNLERTDIDWDAKIPQDRIDRMRSLFGDEVADKWSNKTNLDLIKEGKAPYGPDGERINLHHIGQKPDSPLAELTNTEHKSNDGILHDKTKVSEIERPVFRKEREIYWQNRYNEITNQKQQ